MVLHITQHYYERAFEVYRGLYRLEKEFARVFSPLALAFLARPPHCMV